MSSHPLSAGWPPPCGWKMFRRTATHAAPSSCRPVAATVVVTAVR
ncbi:hypothetical protein [Nonomuraea recticatena]